MLAGLQTRHGLFPALDDPGADRVVGWDDSSGDVEYFELGTGLAFDDDTITLNATLDDLQDTDLADPNDDRLVYWKDSAGQYQHLDLGDGLSIAAETLSVTLAPFDTDDLSQGSSNLYWSAELTDDRVAALIQNGTGISWNYNDGAGTLTPTVSLSGFSLDDLANTSLPDPNADRIVFWDDSDGQYEFLVPNTGLAISGNNLNVSLSAFSTSDLGEGSNLYFTNERVDDRVAALVQNGTGLSWTYNDGSNTLTGNVSLAGFSLDDLANTALADPNADRIVFWDDAPTGQFAFLSLGSSLSISGTTLNTIQAITTTSSPTFAGATLSGLTANRLVQSNGSSALASVSNLASWIAGTANQISVANDGDGSVTLSTPQSIGTGSSPTFAGLTIGSLNGVLKAASGVASGSAGLDDLANTDLADPGADRIPFWDDSDGQWEHLVPNDGLAITGNNLDVTVAAPVILSGGNVTLDLTATYGWTGPHSFGVNDTGVDVSFYGATSGKNLLWDESADAAHFADSTYCRFGAGGAGGGLGCDGQVYSDGTPSTVLLQLESVDSGFMGAYGNPKLVFTVVDPTGFGVYIPCISSLGGPLATGNFMCSRVLYVKDRDGASDAQIIVADSSSSSDQLQIYYNSASNFARFTMQVNGYMALADASGNKVVVGTTEAPSGMLHVRSQTAAAEILRTEGTPATTTNKPSRRWHATDVATTNATQTTLATITIPANTTVFIRATVVARRTGGTAGTAEDGAGYEMTAAVKNVSGTATLIGAVAALATHEDQAGWDATIDVTGATARIRVTGAADNNVDWHAVYTLQSINT